MKLWLCLIAVFLAGCEKPIVQKSVQPLAPPPSIPTLRLWVDFQEVRNKTIAEIRAMNIGCFYIIKPEMRQEMMEMAFEIHLKVTGKPYLATIIEYWMTAQTTGIIDRGSQLLIPTCEDGWQFGDLNADGRVDMTDFSIYAAHSGVPP